MTLKRKNKKIGQKWEQKCQKTINSGAIWSDKGDLKTQDFIVECKITQKKGFRITTQLLEKLWNDALDAHKLPKLIIGIIDTDSQWRLTVDINKEMKNV